MSSWARRSAARDSSGHSSRSVRGEPVTQMLGCDGERRGLAHRLALSRRRRDDGAGQVDVVHGLVVRRPVAVRPDLRGHAERQQRGAPAQPDEPVGRPGQRVGDVRTRPLGHEDGPRAEQVPGGRLRRRRHHRDVGAAEAWRAGLHDQHLPDRGVVAHRLEHGARVALETMGGRIHDERPPVVEPRRPPLVLVEVVGEHRLRHGDRAVGQRVDAEGPAHVVRRRDAPQVRLDRVDVGARGEGEHAFLPLREVGHVERVLVQELALEEGEALAHQVERRLTVDGVEGQDAVDDRCPGGSRPWSGSCEMPISYFLTMESLSVWAETVSSLRRKSGSWMTSERRARK